MPGPTCDRAAYVRHTGDDGGVLMTPLRRHMSARLRSVSVPVSPMSETAAIMLRE